jgi:hypothetical protein
LIVTLGIDGRRGRELQTATERRRGVSAGAGYSLSVPLHRPVALLSSRARTDNSWVSRGVAAVRLGEQRCSPRWPMDVLRRRVLIEDLQPGSLTGP